MNVFDCEIKDVREKYNENIIYVCVIIFQKTDQLLVDFFSSTKNIQYSWN